MKQLILFLTLFFFSTLIQAASITARADRNPVQVNESFNLIFEASGDIDDDPDFSPLKKNFSILNQSQGSSISIINGNYKKTTRWTLVLMANTAGIFTIPSIAFGKDLSPQIRMTVKPEKQSATTDKANLLMELETSTQNTWVQGQIIVTARLLSATNISQFAISKLKTNNMDLVIEKLGDDKRYQTQRGNTAYLVFERKFAIFPQQAGSLQIEPFLGEVEVVSGASSYFDPFRRKTSIKRARSKAIDITVAGIPKQFTGKTWLPATELKLVEEWSAKPGTFKAGEPVTRTLSLLANGLTSAQLPELSIASVKNLKQYPDKPLLKDNKQDDGIIGIRQEKIAVIPTEKGSYTLPAIEIPWWNTNTGQMEVARIAAQTIQVSAGTVNQTPTPQVIDNINPAQPAVTTTAVPASQGSFWFWLSLVLATGWSLTVLIWWWTTRHKSFSKPNINITKTRNLQQARQSLKKACKQNDATACRTALLAWGKLFFENRPSSLAEIARVAGEPLASNIQMLNKMLYSPSPADWSADELMACINKLHHTDSRGPSATDSQLEPLYKQ